uniref:Uncharacterized protein n=1 Tax=Anguilla anguilla TaxID=7936 RepID=A0A0E9PYI8_ANGAN
MKKCRISIIFTGTSLLFYNIVGQINYRNE